jgi:hypothetical protein
MGSCIYVKEGPFRLPWLHGGVPSFFFPAQRTCKLTFDGKVNKGHSPAVVPRTRKRPSALNSSTSIIHSLIVMRHLTVLAALSSEPSRCQSQAGLGLSTLYVRQMSCLALPSHADDTFSLALPRQVPQFIVPTCMKNPLPLLQICSGRSRSRHHSVSTPSTHRSR